MLRRQISSICCLMTLGCQPQQAPKAVLGEPAANEQTDESLKKNKGDLNAEDGEVGADATKLDASCGAGWLMVPGDADYNTKDFCVMAFEARDVDKKPVSQANGKPEVSITWSDAKAKCMLLGEDYALINNDEWMTLAAHIAGHEYNWFGLRDGKAGWGAKGKPLVKEDVAKFRLQLARGHSDINPESICDSTQEVADKDCANSVAEDDPLQRRTHKLLNGEDIWDLSGNVWEWVDLTNTDAKPFALADKAPAAGFREHNVINQGFEKMPKAALVPEKKSYWDPTWTSAQGIGGYFAGLTKTGGALMRGGFFGDRAQAGIFFADLSRGPQAPDTYIGYRCVKHP